MQTLLTFGGLAGDGPMIGAAPLLVLLVVALLFHCVAAALDRG